MRRCLTIGRREYLAAVKTKGFLIGLVVAPIMMCGGIIAMVALRGQVDVTDKRIALVDRAGGLGPALVSAADLRTEKDIVDAKSGKRLKPAYVIELVAPQVDQLPAQRLALSERVRRGELHAFVEIGPEVLTPGTNHELSRVSYHAKGAALDDIRRWLEQPLNKEMQRVRLAAAGIEESRVRDIFNWKQVEPMGLVSADPTTGQAGVAKRSSEAEAIAAPVACVILIWIMVMMGASPLLGAVMAEKSQRIIEVLLGCATPLEIMAGKLLGALGVALTSSAVYLAGALFALFQMGIAGFAPLHLLPWFLVYVVLAILMTGGNAVALGAVCNDQRDAQNLTLPSILPMLIPMFLLGPVLREPNSTFALVSSLIPPFTPVLMLMRQATPAGVPLWQPIVGLVGVCLFTALVLLAGSRIFRVGLLMQGKPPHLRDLLRWAWRG
jgi:ABC-2 type transport system permease protein